jgi:N-acetylglutamate synthase-like GNAT family acetyltransferase
MNIATDLNYATILNYNISLDKRGIGFGSKLFDVFEKSIIRFGYPEIRLYLVSTKAEKFWTKKGFRKINHVWRKKI